MVVIVETPYLYESDIVGVEYEIYLNRCLRDCLLRGESPIATHAMYTRPGILSKCEGGLASEASDGLAEAVGVTVLYTDYGITSKMNLGLDRASFHGHDIFYREIGRSTKDDYARSY